MTVQRKSYTSGHFELVIDGHKSTAYLKSVDGGHTKASHIDEPVGPHNQRVKHIATLDIEPFSLDFGLAGGKDVLKWIQESWNKNYTRRNGQITHANFNLEATYEHEFWEALLTETTFPTLDGAAKDTAYLKVKFQPEQVKPRIIAPGAKLVPSGSQKQKLWTANSFRFNIDGIDEMRFTNKIESFTVKQGVKKMYTGESRYAQIEPTKLEFPNIVGTISMEYAQGLSKWHQDYIEKGQSDPRAQRTGSIEFLSPGKKDTLFTINLFEMGLSNLQVMQSQANQDSIKRVKFELYVGRMEMDGGGALGMD